MHLLTDSPCKSANRKDFPIPKSKTVMHTRNGQENLQEVDVNHTLFGKFGKFFDSVQISLKRRRKRRVANSLHTSLPGCDKPYGTTSHGGDRHTIRAGQKIDNSLLFTVIRCSSVIVMFWKVRVTTWFLCPVDA